MAEMKVDTYKLNQYAQRLANVNARIARLDRRLDSLYWKVGLLGLWNLMRADAMTCYSWRLDRCRSYLEQTASDLDNTENAILREDPLSFKGFITGRAVSVVKTDTKSDKKDDERSWFAKFINNEIKDSASVLSGEKEGKTEIWGIDTAGKISGAILTGEVGLKNRASFKFKDKDGNWDFKSFGVSTEAYATGAVASGEVEGNFGYLHGKVGGKALTGGVKGEVKCTIYDDGQLNPSLSVGASAEVSALQGEAEIGFGTDQYGIYGKADGDVLHAEAEAKAGIGYLGKDKDGKATYGASAEASAMASVAQGKVKGGFTIFGIDIDIGAKGYAVAAGVEAGGSITTNGVKAKFSGALGLGVGLDVSIDWSDAKWIGKSVDAVGNFVGDAVDFVGDTADYIGDKATDLYEGAVDFATDVYEGAVDFAEDVGEAASNLYEGAASFVEDAGDFLFGWI